MVIYNTSGSYYLDNEVWEGRQRSNYLGTRWILVKTIFTQIFKAAYSVRFDRAEIEVDSVLYIPMTDFLVEPILGSIKG